MKPAARISGPVLAFGVVSLILTLLIAWYGWQRQAARQNQSHDAPPTILAATEPEAAPEAESDGTKPIPARSFPDGLPPVIPISLVPHLIEAENNSWLNDAEYLLVPRGTQHFGGIEFHLEGLLQLQGRGAESRRYKYRSLVSIPLAVTNVTDNGREILQRGRGIASVYLLGGSRYETEAEAVVANVIWRYTDGTSTTTPLQYNIHLRDWIREPFELPDRLPYAFTKVIWTAPAAKPPSERALRLYRVGLANPAPQKTIQQLDFTGMTGGGTLFVAGLTLDPLRLGERADGTPDLEPTDSRAGNLLHLQVVGPDQQAVPKAKIRLQLRGKPGTPGGFTPRTLVTDDAGALAIKYSVENLERFDVSAAHEDHGARKMVWDLGSGDSVPASYTLQLGAAISIGGTVVDDTEQPIAGATLSFSRFWSGGDDMNAKGEQVDFQSRSTTTDSQGGWEVKGVPPPLLDRIHLKASHSDFVGTNITLGGEATREMKFRGRTHKLVLHRGLIVRGRVVDEREQPINDARVWAGKMNSSGTQETRTDARGEFSFRNLGVGAQQFSVLAKGFKPEVKNITIAMESAEIVFRLGAGAVIRGVVKDEAGEPVAGVRLALESSSGGVAQDIQFNMTSDQAGRFEWDGAPEEPRYFAILKQGYETKRRQLLKTTEENVVTLRKGRKVQAWVLDAETEKPITKFRAGVGRSYTLNSSESFSADNPGMKDYSAPNGAFTVEVNEETITAIKAEADDYAAKVEQLPAAQDGVVQVVLRLKPSAALRGVLVDLQGSPVAGATVALTSGNAVGQSVQLRNGRLSTYDRNSKIVTTDASGSFTLPSPPESGGIVAAAAESGFATAPAEQVRTSGRLILQGFGRIAGTIKIGGVPTAGQEFTFSLRNIGVSMDFNSYKATSDEQGRFTMEKIPAGEGAVVRLIKMGNTSWRHSHNTPVSITPGQTTPVAFGEDGAVLKGRVRLDFQPAEGETLTFDGSLNTKRPDVPANFATPEEASAFYKSEEWQTLMKQMKNYGVTINADGTFTADAIPPGEYTLTVTADKPGEDPWRQTPVATGSTTIIVPNTASPYVPIGLNDIVLKATKK